MPTLFDLLKPIVVAPMAGGPSTPELVIAAAHAGALGFLPAGYRSPADLMDLVTETRASAGLFGVNLFVPEDDQGDLDDVRAYRDELKPLADQLGVPDLPDPTPDDDAFDAKIEALLDDPVPFVSFTFGCPEEALVRRLRDRGTTVLATVTCVDDAGRAEAAGVDALIVQGPEAGGHRATFACGTAPGTTSLGQLVTEIKLASDLPLVATGGLGSPIMVTSALRLADAVQLGTAFLLADEAGTSSAHRAALVDPAFTETAVTRAFSGRPARGLRNAFMDQYGPSAPPAYPGVNQVTTPIRRAAAAAGDLQHVHLWAGTAWQEARPGPASEILDRLLG